MDNPPLVPSVSQDILKMEVNVMKILHVMEHQHVLPVQEPII